MLLPELLSHTLFYHLSVQYLTPTPLSSPYRSLALLPLSYPYSSLGPSSSPSTNRYYSNAFTDMVKQDAMNVFLGFYIPQEMTVPLWDLDSDYYLHNRSYRPPTPHINRILFDERRLSGAGAGGSIRDYNLLGEIEGTERGRGRYSSGSRVMQEEVARKYFINTHALRKQGVLRIGDSEVKGILAISEGRKSTENGEKEIETEGTEALCDGADSGGGEHLA